MLTGHRRSGFVRADDASDAAVDDDAETVDLLRREIFRRVPPDDERLVEVRLERQLLRRRHALLRQAAGCVRLLVLGVIEVWK